MFIVVPYVAMEAVEVRRTLPRHFTSKEYEPVSGGESLRNSYVDHQSEEP
jgi:hypothetical protein